MGARSRQFFSAKADAGQTESIAIDETMPFNSTLIQFHVVLSEIPSVDQVLSVEKISAVGTEWNINLRDWNPYEDNLSTLLCNERFEFRKGDHLVINYANTADITVAVEAVIQEAD